MLSGEIQVFWSLTGAVALFLVLSWRLSGCLIIVNLLLPAALSEEMPLGCGTKSLEFLRSHQI